MKSFNLLSGFISENNTLLKARGLNRCAQCKDDLQILCGEQPVAEGLHRRAQAAGARLRARLRGDESARLPAGA